MHQDLVTEVSQVHIQNQVCVCVSVREDVQRVGKRKKDSFHFKKYWAKKIFQKKRTAMSFIKLLGS